MKTETNEELNYDKTANETITTVSLEVNIEYFLE